MIEEVKYLAKKYLSEIISYRRHLHANPELSFQEIQTSKYVQSNLNKIGIHDIKEMAGTGIVAEIKGINPDKKVVALRADMDALPILEANDVPYCEAVAPDSLC